MTATEVNFDGLVGPTHNYAGLSFGNVASHDNAGAVSAPREAALQGLAKMWALVELGLVQGVIPPHDRPHVEGLRAMGFSGADEEVLARASQDEPELFAGLCSASAMWTANAATVSPSADTGDGKVHFTPANLAAKFHRAFEPPLTGRILARIFRSPDHFRHHPPVPCGAQFGDEGAANHTRLCASHGQPGVEMFVYGRRAFPGREPRPRRFPARQALEASRAIARLHGLAPNRVLFVQQDPEAIDAGVFHNDVIAVGNENVLLYHQDAFVDGERVLADLNESLRALAGRLVPVRIDRDAVPIEKAVSSYLFNSQLVTLAPGRMLLVTPTECHEDDDVRAAIDALVADSTNPIDAVRYFDLRQSMRNGGGPACLRLRVVLTAEERAAVNPACLLDAELNGRLRDWISKRYRERLTPSDMADPQLLIETRTALDELTQILALGSVYPFQQA